MLTRKMTQKGLIRNGFLSLIALVSVAATRGISDMSQRATADTTQLSFDTLLLKLTGASETDILNAPAISMNKYAVKYVDSYIADNTELLEDIKDRSGKYFKVADEIFANYGLPQELKYLAVVESELKMNALSKVGARGPWQLMPETARIFSLRVTRKYDERTHYYKSTVAAARYMKDLYAIFGDWLLVIASYNSGPGKVLTAIKKSGSRNFWKLQNFLPEETRGHVKKFVATHYYFEGKGSVTTLTKAEATSYKKEMLAFVTKHNSSITQAQPEIASEISIKGDLAKRTTNNSIIE